MTNPVEQVRGLLSTPAKRLRLIRGEDVEVHLDTGEVLDATVASVRSRTAAASRITARAKSWSRWRGTPEDVVAVTKEVVTEIVTRASEDPSVSVRITFSGNEEEERYFDLSTFEREMRSAESGSLGARLQEVNQIDIAVGPTRNGALKANALFNRGVPAVIWPGPHSRVDT